MLPGTPEAPSGSLSKTGPVSVVCSTPNDTIFDQTPAHHGIGGAADDAVTISSDGLSSKQGSEHDSQGLIDLIDNACAKHMSGKEDGNVSALRSVCRHLFIHDSERFEISKSEELSFGEQMKRRAKAVVDSSFFVGFFLLLTLYCLFGPDLSLLLGTPQDDWPIAVFNSVVLCLFVFELCMMSWASSDYVCTAQFWLDLLACLSLLGDTHFMQELLDSDAVVAGKGSRMSRMARMASRSSRLTRVTRAVRVARISRLLPRLQRFLMINNVSKGDDDMVSVLLNKRLWRIFRYLDSDNDDMVSEADASLCRATLFNEFRSKLDRRRSTFFALRRSMSNSSPEWPWSKLFPQPTSNVTMVKPLVPEPTAHAGSKESSSSTKFKKNRSRDSNKDPNKAKAHEGEDEEVDLEGAKGGKKAKGLNFDRFIDSLFRGTAGRAFQNCCRSEIMRGGGGWNITQKLTERTAIKVCIGVILLLILLPLFEADIKDMSKWHNLWQLHDLAVYEHGLVVPDNGYTCQQVSLYANGVAQGALLYLVLDGRLYWNGRDSGCIMLEAGIPTPELLSIEEAVRHQKNVQNLRMKEMEWACAPDVSCGTEDEPARSYAVMDVKKAFREDVGTGINMTLTVITLILVFIWVFNRETSVFSRKFLKPLRILADDMTAMTMMELVYSEKDYPRDLVALDVMEEMNCLQQSFNQLRGVVRSWAKYVPPSVALRLFSTGVEARIGVTRCQVTILFCDINGFDDICSMLKPSELLNFLSMVLGTVADAIDQNKGTLLEFIGDEVVAVFNIPTPLTNHAQHAMLAALQFHQRITNLQQWFDQCHPNCPELSLRCGVHTAKMLAGNIGSHRRMKYGLLGDGINLTARLKGLNSRYGTGVIISDEAVLALGKDREAYVARPVDMVVVKGRSKPTVVYELMGWKNPETHKAHKHRSGNGDTVFSHHASHGSDLTDPTQEPRLASGDPSDLNSPDTKKKGKDQRGYLGPYLHSYHLEDLCATHKLGFEYYLARRFNEALTELRKVCVMAEEEHRQDEPARMLIGRCLQYALDPPPANWDGAERLTQKTWVPPQPGQVSDQEKKDK